MPGFRAEGSLLVSESFGGSYIRSDLYQYSLTKLSIDCVFTAGLIILWLTSYKYVALMGGMSNF